MNTTAQDLLIAIKGFIDNNPEFKTSPNMYDPLDLEKCASFNALKKDDNGILRNFNITIKQTTPPSDPETYNKKSELYKDLFDK